MHLLAAALAAVERAVYRGGLSSDEKIKIEIFDTLAPDVFSKLWSRQTSAHTPACSLVMPGLPKKVGLTPILRLYSCSTMNERREDLNCGCG